MLFVIEPLFLDRSLARRAAGTPQTTYRRIEWLHRGLRCPASGDNRRCYCGQRGRQPFRLVVHIQRAIIRFNFAADIFDDLHRIF